jgi:large subunit ribosomal protein L4
MSVFRTSLARLAATAACTVSTTAPAPGLGGAAAAGSGAGARWRAAASSATPAAPGLLLPGGGLGRKAQGGSLLARWQSSLQPEAASGAAAPTPIGAPLPLAPPLPPVSAPLVDPATGATLGSVPLPPAVFGLPLRRDILHRVVVWQAAKARQGGGAAKSRASVRGGGRKPWAQKGSGRARAGSTRSPLWVGGGKAHPPTPRSFEVRCNKKVRALGLATALSARAAEGRLLVVDSLAGWSGGKAASLAAGLAATLPPGARPSVLLADAGPEAADGGADLRRAASNLRLVEVLPPIGLNVASILRRDTLVMTRGAVAAVCARLGVEGGV